VAADHLHTLCIRADACPPVDDRIRLRVDGRQRRPCGRGEVLEEGKLDRAGPPEHRQVEGLGQPNPRHGEWRDVIGVGQWRAQSNDSLDHLGMAVAGDFGQQSAAAVPDQGDPLAEPTVEVDQAEKDGVQHVF